ncbi:MAG: hypothetical protein ACK56I_35005, partial [bacterium]
HPDAPHVRRGDALDPEHRLADHLEREVPDRHGALDAGDRLDALLLGHGHAVGLEDEAVGEPHALADVPDDRGAVGPRAGEDGDAHHQRPGGEAEPEGRLPHRAREQPARDRQDALERGRRRLRHDPQHGHGQHEP